MKNTSTPYAINIPKTKEQMDELARAMSNAWDGSFSPAPQFDGKKKNKLRDVASRFAGFPNGYQQFLAYINPEKSEVCSDYACLESDISLPNEVCIATVPWDITQQFNIVKNLVEAEKMEWLCENDDNVIHALAHDELDKQAVKDTLLWKHISQHYAVYRTVMVMPNIDEYGIEDEATHSGALEFIQSFNLESFLDFEADASDRRDDGVGTFVIYLRKK